MNFLTLKNKTSLEYKKQLPDNLKEIYEEITKERRKIYYKGYILGFILSIFIILGNVYLEHKMLSTTSMVCLVLATSFITNYFYYTLSSKKKWMLDNINTPEQTKAWLEMYKTMQKYYHTGLLLGIIAVGIFAHAFRKQEIKV